MPRHERPPRHRALSAAEALPLLHAGRVRLLGRMPRASNPTFLCQVLDDSGRPLLAVYKPRDGETPLWDFPDGTLCLREQAAFEVSEALGDRKSGHCLLEGGTGGIRLVDHGVAFHERPNLRTVVWEFARRARDLVARGAYPEPGPGRPYPWPPV